VPPHLAEICGRCLSNISLLGCRPGVLRVASTRVWWRCCPTLKSSVLPHANRKLRPMANFVPTTHGRINHSGGSIPT